MKLRITAAPDEFETRKREILKQGYRIEEEQPVPVHGLCSFVAVRVRTNARRRQPKRQQLRPRVFELDRAAVRAVVGSDRFHFIERLRRLYPQGESFDEMFWQQTMRHIVKAAEVLPNPHLVILRAKVAHLCAGMGISESHIDALLTTLDFDRFARAAKANRCIQQLQSDARYRDVWTETSITRDPPLRVEFEHAVVLGSVTDANSIARSKAWGRLVGFGPLLPGDQLYPVHITYMLKASSKQRMRWEFRNTFRELLGAERRLVTHAMQNAKGSFIEQISAEDMRTLRTRLQLDPGSFWTAVRYGEKFGPNGIEAFLKRLEESTKGYWLDFRPTQDELVQIQPVG